MRLGLCIIHKELIEELRQDIAAAFTCLSGLVLNGETGEVFKFPADHFIACLICAGMQRPVT